MSQNLTLPDEIYERLRGSAERDGVDIPRLLEILLTQSEHPRDSQSGCGSGEHAGSVIALSERPFRRDPRLMGIKFNEDPSLPIGPEDWPGAFD